MFRNQSIRKKIINSAVLLLVVIYGLQVFNKSFYLHTHVMADGKVVTHAHPYNKSDDTDPIKSHSHTLDQLLVLASIDFLFPVVFLLLILLNIRAGESVFRRFIREKQPSCIILHKGRAPPVS